MNKTSFTWQLLKLNARKFALLVEPINYSADLAKQTVKQHATCNKWQLH